MIEQLIALIFATRNAAHLAHWRTKSFSQHMALNEFYDDVLEVLDKLVEAHQGAFELIGKVELDQPVVKEILQRLEADMVWISENRPKITGKLPALDNILQELEGVYLKAIYKLRNLQ